MIPAISHEPSLDPAAAQAALVLDVMGTWALLWFPDSGRSDWVDLARVDYERFEPSPRPSSDED